MSVSYYDEALYNKIKSWVKDTRMRILKPEESLRLFQLSADLENDKPVTLPLISLSRDTNIAINYTHKKPMSFDGLMVRATTKQSQQINAIPIVINYQIDIYTKKLSTADEYVRNFVFNIVNHPKLTIEIPYNGINYLHECNIRLVSPLQDNSDIPQRLFSGQFTRWTISLTIDDAYLFSAPVEMNVGVDDIEVEPYFVNKSNKPVTVDNPKTEIVEHDFAYLGDTKQDKPVKDEYNKAYYDDIDVNS